jgi:hypothetical protein
MVIRTKAVQVGNASSQASRWRDVIEAEEDEKKSEMVEEYEILEWRT